MRAHAIKVTLITFFYLVSCESREIDIESVNNYIIDNQSSYDLFYNTGSGLDERTIQIDRLDQIVIEVGRVYASTEPLSAYDFFVDALDVEFYLLRENDGEIIQALQLSAGNILEWHTDSLSEYTYNHTLVVTDDLIN